jgi:hypothetical protein
VLVCWIRQALLSALTAGDFLLLAQKKVTKEKGTPAAKPR